jgi:hypothetical protein
MQENFSWSWLSCWKSMPPPGTHKNTTIELWLPSKFCKDREPHLERRAFRKCATTSWSVSKWGTMKSIRDTLQEKESALKTLQSEIAILRAAAKIVAADKLNGSGERRGGTLSQPQMIRVALLDRGRPLHVDELARAIEKRFSVRLKRTDITPTIYRAIRGKRLFRKFGTNTFGLLEWTSSRPNRSAKRPRRNGATRV